MSSPESPFRRVRVARRRRRKGRHRAGSIAHYIDTARDAIFQCPSVENLITDNDYSEVFEGALRGRLVVRADLRSGAVVVIAETLTTNPADGQFEAASGVYVERFNYTIWHPDGTHEAYDCDPYRHRTETFPFHKVTSDDDTRRALDDGDPENLQELLWLIARY